MSGWIKKLAVTYILKRYLPMEKIWKWLDGKKTYFAGLGIIIAGISEYIASKDVGKLVTAILAGITIICGRQAIAKIEKKVTPEG
jgi:hypothetical protein